MIWPTISGILTLVLGVNDRYGAMNQGSSNA
jgi:hypothetical protein